MVNGLYADLEGCEKVYAKTIQNGIMGNRVNKDPQGGDMQIQSIRTCTVYAEAFSQANFYKSGVLCFAIMYTTLGNYNKALIL